jgi:hypothetical protein
MNDVWTVFWKLLLIFLGFLVLLSGVLRSPGFWSSYLLDISGPAMVYVLLRARYKTGSPTFLTIRFSPEIALQIVVIICFLIETSQYFRLYPSHFDPFDFLAYISGVAIVYALDKWVFRIPEKI